MKQVNIPSGTYLIQEVPEDANVIKMGAECPACLSIGIWHCAHADTCGNNFPAIKAYDGTWWLCSTRIETPGKWQLLGADPTRLTEEEAGEIVECYVAVDDNGHTFMEYFKDYSDPQQIVGSDYSLLSAVASISSLAGSLGISKPFVVLKNKNNEHT